ncbi:hypothetical protein NW762_013407 [Fusarium torreyae]|uniref:Uncharacterized protein n=1 Tax=Fusarium torreyae TaxID=1237075 RepID=A0A9W8RNH7_9HYPO|nr:hypothetical protein NW762_013407 [Fusarium torreyae]
MLELRKSISLKSMDVAVTLEDESFSPVKHGFFVMSLSLALPFVQGIGIGFSYVYALNKAAENDPKKDDSPEMSNKSALTEQLIRATTSDLPWDFILKVAVSAKIKEFWMPEAEIVVVVQLQMSMWVGIAAIGNTQMPPRAKGTQEDEVNIHGSWPPSRRDNTVPEDGRRENVTMTGTPPIDNTVNQIFTYEAYACHSQMEDDATFQQQDQLWNQYKTPLATHEQHHRYQHQPQKYQHDQQQRQQ